MKKQFFALAAVGIAACCLGACKNADDNSEYDALNTMLKASYSEIEITVTDTFAAGDVLESKFVITYAERSITVDYTVEQFVEISLDWPTSTGAKQTFSGSAVIVGEAVAVKGDQIDYDFVKLAHPSYNFQKKYFKNAQLTANYMQADVDNPKGFMGNKITCSKMKVSANFLEAFSQLEISYISSAGNQINYKYAFTL